MIYLPYGREWKEKQEITKRLLLLNALGETHTGYFETKEVLELDRIKGS